MALIVEDGTGKVNAESYTSVAVAAAYHLSIGQGEAWDLIDDQEAALRKATLYMLQAYRGRWAGMRVTVAQRLDWPRAWVPIEDAPSGYRDGSAYVANNIVPTDVQNACAELALQSASGSLNANITQGKKRVKVDVIEVEFDSNDSQAVQYRSIDMMLDQYLEGNSAMVKLVRT